MFTILHDIVQYIYAAIANKPTTLVLKDLVLSLVKEFFRNLRLEMRKTTSFNEDFNGRQEYEIYIYI